MTWTQTTSSHFTARHDERDARDVGGVLDLLEDARSRIGAAFGSVPDEVTIVLHPSRAELDLAQPFLPIVRRVTTPSARRYLAGWAGRSTLHVLAPRLLTGRAANVEGSLEMLMLTPAALYAQLVIAAANPALPPPWNIGRSIRAARWAWLVAGGAQWFSGQTAHARFAVARRMREGPRPEFPPGLRDAALLGGTVIDLVAREEGRSAAVRLVSSLPRGGSREALVSAFNGRALVHTEGTWRAHLARMAGR
ncbi:MAG: hypothetical protein ACR2HD_09675 [Solirubrobacteraceae bacterium]